MGSIAGSTHRKPPLPIDALLPEILAHLRAQPSLVLQAEPGAGKTTRVPPALFDVVAGEVIVLEPRRIAARMAARRVAWELGEKPGVTVGYQVRFEEVGGPRTRLRFVTEGVLVRRMLADPLLRGVDAVILDEFHERHIDSDLALALLRHLQQTQRPDLKVVVMSATLDAAPVAQFLGDCPIVTAHGRAFPLTVEHLPYTPDPLHLQVRAAVEKLLRERHAGHTLVFLPGAAEIRRAMRECGDVARAAGLLMLPLYGDLSPADQDLAVGPSAQPKLILATNVAESSVTVEGVTAVIDSGLARVASDSPWTGLPTLHVARISRASATQRAGRAGRTAPGRVLRLYPEQDFLQRPAQDTPELLRSDLSGLCLLLRGMGLSVDALPWLDQPPARAVEAAEMLLDRLGAEGETGKAMARLPLPPRLARVVVESERRSAAAEGCMAAALLSAGASVERSDLLEALDVQAGVSADGRPDPRVTQTAQQLRRIVGVRRDAPHASDDALLMSVLAGFPDRVARRRAGKVLLLANGVSAECSGEPPPYEFLVALDAEDRSDKPMPLVRMTSRIEPDWLLDLFPDNVRELSVLSWNHKAERVEAVSELRYDDLLLQEWRNAKPDPVEGAAMLAAKALEAGIERFIDAEALDNLQARAVFAGLSPVDVAAELQLVSDGVFSFTELKRVAANLVPMLESKLDAQQLRELAPATLKLKHGKPMKVHYEVGKPPYVAARMQDFFGMQEGPRIGPERTLGVMHLLGPNNRPVQQTADLAGFWERLYPEVRRGLMRRYPRHPWPENPLKPNAGPKLCSRISAGKTKFISSSAGQIQS